MRAFTITMKRITACAVLAVCVPMLVVLAVLMLDQALLFLK